MAEKQAVQKRFSFLSPSLQKLLCHYRLVIALLLLINLLLAATSTFNKSLTYDEPIYIGVGKYMLKTGDTLALAPGNPPPLAFFLNSLFWMFLKFDPSFWEQFRHLYTTSSNLPIIFNSGYDPDLLVFLARLPVILTFPLLGLLIFTWSRELFGVKAALFALTLAVFCPNLIAHETLSTTDFLASLTILAAVYAFRRFMKNQSLGTLVGAGVLLGLALLSKFTTIFLIPSFFFIALLVGWRKIRTEDAAKPGKEAAVNPPHGRAGDCPKNYGPCILGRRFGTVPTAGAAGAAALLLAVAFLVVWAGYFFELRSFRSFPLLELAPPGGYVHGILGFLYAKGIKIPAASYFANFLDQALHGKVGHPGFLLGETSTEGWWFYFPVVLLLKTPIPILILMGIGLVSFLKLRNMEEEAFLVVPIAVYLGASVISNVNIGMRHILPIFPLLYIWISRLAAIKAAKWYSGLVAVLLLWHIGESVCSFPHYLEYFNEIIGGPKNGYKYLVDSNLDWGQDLKRLVHYLKKNNIKPERIAYFGVPHLLEYYGYQDTARDCRQIEDGYLAISATFLYNLYLEPGCYDWLKKYEPVDRVGYSMFIYRFPSAERRSAFSQTQKRMEDGTYAPSWAANPYQAGAAGS